MKLILLYVMLALASVKNETPDNLFSKSAILLDGDSGRVLFEKNGRELLPNASTTKILTCIVALENAELNDIVTISEYAASMPDVQLNIRAGERYYLKDLLYSLMLESHNDTAVAIAEYVAGSVKEFADMMNKKARELGCYDTYFITPNGLDAADEKGIHCTTAENLALIMKYCIQNEEFLNITGAKSHEFSDLDGKRQFVVNNKNSFLNMYPGMISGKTGFTGNAGYCYVGACRREGKTMIIALLGCGWPPHKTRKWKDAEKLLNYGMKNYRSQNLKDTKYEKRIMNVPVEGGEINRTELRVEEVSDKTVLLGKNESISIRYCIPDKITAPIDSGTVVGRLLFKVGDEIIFCTPVCATENIGEISSSSGVERLIKMFLFN